jgi:precorrin-6Y C5,15-methyltransferase (decarboxylating)
LTLPPIHVIGLGIAGWEGLDPAARDALRAAEIIIGSPRHLQMLPTGLAAEQRHYPSPFGALADTLEELAGRPVCLLASGDPLLHGIGGWLKRNPPAQRLVFHGNLSSIQAAFARIGLPWQDAEVVSVHGRPLTTLRPRLGVNRLLALLTDSHSHPAAIAGELLLAGHGAAQVWVAEALGTDRERVRHFRATELAEHDGSFHQPNVVIIDTGPLGHGLEFPGLPDTAFVTDGEAGKGMLSKREVRLNILSLLQPAAGETGWDVGAGCGGVAVEWTRWQRRARVYAVETHAARLRALRANRERFGVTANLHIVEGRAPEALEALPDPDAIFIGGSDGSLEAILETGWRRLRPGGRLVASAVTEPTRATLQTFAGDRPAQWTQIAVSRGEHLAGQLTLRPFLPVLLMRLDKPHD